MTQGDLVSPTLFNVIKDNVIQEWLALTVEDKRADLDGVGENVNICLGVFHANDNMVGYIDSNCLKHSMKILIRIFRRYGLAANIAKSHTMTCQPGALRSGMSEEARECKCTGVGDYYRKRLRRRIPCPECGVEITTGSMMAHRC